MNFSFWSEDSDNKYTVTYKGKAYTGYWSLCAAVNRALDVSGFLTFTMNSIHATIQRMINSYFFSCIMRKR